ncbi:hypothetical protein, partial [Intestinimonas butyriciproducens]|uniref:hypothetical protein n=1 Tax=Intestinimonas butyriciproducens TaxID=1297617 RepID=UPI00195ABAC1
LSSGMDSQAAFFAYANGKLTPLVITHTDETSYGTITTYTHTVATSTLDGIVTLKLTGLTEKTTPSSYTETYSHAGITITATTSQEEALPDPDSVTAKPHGTQITSG